MILFILKAAGWVGVLKSKGKETTLCEFKWQYEDNYICEKVFDFFFPWMYLF